MSDIGARFLPDMSKPLIPEGIPGLEGTAEILRHIVALADADETDIAQAAGIIMSRSRPDGCDLPGLHRFMDWFCVHYRIISGILLSAADGQLRIVMNDNDEPEFHVPLDDKK